METKNEKGLYKHDEVRGLLFAQVKIGTTINVKEHINKPEATEIKDGWRVFYTHESALKYYNIDEQINEQI